MRAEVSLIALIISLIVLSLAHPARADEVYLKNGDLITGEITTSEDGLLVVETAYAKKIKVKWEEVACVASDKEVTLLLKNNDKIVGRATCPALGSIQLTDQQSGETRDFFLADLLGINPPPPPPPR